MTDSEKRTLFIMEVMDEIKAFWLANMDTMDLCDVINTVMDIDTNEFDDVSFRDKLTFEMEQLAGEIDE